MINLKRHIAIALAYFLLVALMGVFLRLFYVFPIPANYRFVVHAHSHTALLGWVYVALTTLIYKIFLASAKRGKVYKWIFLFTNVCIVGMLLTFPIQGYALFSIIFSTLFLVASYWFTWFALKNIPVSYKNRFSWKLVRASLVYLVFSSLGPWAIGGVMATLGPSSIWYKLAIYFYLHFQYNGWFILAILGTLFYIFEEVGIRFSPKKQNRFYALLNSGVVLSFFLSVLWVNPPVVFYVLAALGAVIQGIAFYQLYNLLKQKGAQVLKPFSTVSALLLKGAGLLLLGKLVMQLLTAIPYFADLAFRIPDFVIGYLHWTFLGIISVSLFALLSHFGLIKIPKSFLWIYITGFILTESLIFYKAISIWIRLPILNEYFILLAVASCLFFIAILLLLISNYTKRKINGSPV